MPAQVFFHFEPESQNQVQHHGRSHGETGGVDKIEPDAADRDIHFLTQ